MVYCPGAPDSSADHSAQCWPGHHSTLVADMAVRGLLCVTVIQTAAVSPHSTVSPRHVCCHLESLAPVINISQSQPVISSQDLQQ